MEWLDTRTIARVIQKFICYVLFIYTRLVYILSKKRLNQNEVKEIFILMLFYFLYIHYQLYFPVIRLHWHLHVN